jgi:uncharacterized protein YcfJ
MKKALFFSATSIVAALGTVAHAEEIGRVISSTPVIQQVAVPRQICTNQPMAVQQPNTGAGAVMGGIAGGAVGNTIGHGSGRAAATVLGLVGGALLGNNVEGSGSYVQNVQQCTTQTFYENRTTGYNVVYEYAGKEFNAQMPYDPGATIRLQLTPMASNMPDAPTPQASGMPPPTQERRPDAVPGTPVGVIVGSPTGTPVMAPAPITSYTTIHPAYPSAYPAYPAYPAYYARPMFYGPPLGLSLNLGYIHHRHSGHRHGGRRHR